MEVTTIKNILDPELVESIEDTILYTIPHVFGHTTIIGTPKKLKVRRWYSQDIGIEQPMILFIIKKLKKHFNFKKVTRVYTNIQHPGMDGYWHVDDGDYTIILMLSKTLNKGEGCLQIKKDKVKNYSFEQNKAIGFNSKLQHRALAPKTLGEIRVTMAFKTI